MWAMEKGSPRASPDSTPEPAGNSDTVDGGQTRWA